MEEPNDSEFINLTEENIDDEILCCIIRSKIQHPGVEAKRKWVKERLSEGHIYRKINRKATVFIEYAPLENAWVPIIGNNYIYIYCLWAEGECKGKGYGKKLMDYCIQDAKNNKKSGICMIGSNKQKAWLTDQSFAKKYGFVNVDSSESGYELLALSLDGTVPHFTDSAKKSVIESNELTIYYDLQCPYILKSIDTVKAYCETYNVDVSFKKIDCLKKAKSVPCVFNNWSVFYKGKLQTVNLLLDENSIRRILNKK